MFKDYGQGYTNLALATEQGEGHVLIIPQRFTYITQGRWTSVSNTLYAMYTLFYNVTNAQNDRVDYYVWLSKGTYTLSLFQTQGAMGICTYYLDAASLGAIDWYNASDLYGVVDNTLTGISVTTSGKHTFSVKVTSKNASSGNYYAYLHSMAWFRTA